MPCCRVVQCRGSINVPNQSNGFSFTAWGILGVPRSTLNAAAAPVHSSPVLGALCREGASLGRYLPCLPYPGRSGKSHRLVLSCLVLPSVFCRLPSAYPTQRLPSSPSPPPPPPLLLLLSHTTRTFTLTSSQTLTLNLTTLQQ